MAGAGSPPLKGIFRAPPSMPPAMDKIALLDKQEERVLGEIQAEVSSPTGM